MDERDFRATLSKEELEKRAFIVPLKVYDPAVFERLEHYSTTLNITYDELINAAIVKLVSDMIFIHNLRDDGKKEVKQTDKPPPTQA